MTQLFANNAFSTLAGAISNTATTMSVQAGAGAKFPSPTGGDYFLVTLFQLIGGIESNHEVVKVTARSVDTFTIVRAQEGTTARAWGVGDQVSHRSTAGSLGALAQLGASGQAFTQPVAVPTASPGTNTTIAASTEFVTAAIVQAKSDLTAGSPSALDTLNELAAALGNDANFSATTATALGNRLRVDVNTQSLNSTQKANAVTNLGLATVATSGAKADVGLGNVDNTSDANKPVSTATQTALDAKAPLASPALTGTPSLRNGAGATACMEMAGNNNVVGTGSMLYGQDQASVGYFWNRANAAVVIGTNGTERARVDSSGNLLVGTSTVRARTTISGGSGFGLSVTGRSSSDVTGDIEINRSSTSASVAQGCALTFNDSGTPANTWLIQGGAGNFQFFSFAGGSWNEKARFDIDGNLLVGATSGSNHIIQKTVTNDSGFAIFAVQNGSGSVCAAVAGVTGTGYSSTSAGLYVNKSATANRSINAAGTINASGADYAEYMTKAENCGTLAKGQIVGVDAHGLLTDKWANAVSFLIKSTDPSYVGGDVWGTEEAIGLQRPDEPVFVAPAYEGVAPVLTEPAEDDSDEIRAQRQQYADDQQAHNSVVTAARHQFDTVTMPAYQAALAVFEAKLEAARQKVDRIAYCGQVPVNVIGATPGQYVVPARTADDGITAVLVPAADMTLAWYMSAVGVVQNILPDGRANIRVKPV